MKNKKTTNKKQQALINYDRLLEEMNALGKFLRTRDLSKTAALNAVRLSKMMRVD